MFPSEARPNGAAIGLYATEDLVSGTIVERCLGRRVSWNDVPAGLRAFPLGPGNLWIPDTAARHLAFSPEPSCAIEPSLEVVTTRAVRRGEPLSVSHDALAAAFSAGDPPGP